MRLNEQERDKLCADLYEGEKSRNFMLHLVRAYAKLDKVKKVWDFREKQKHRCAVCETKLFDITGGLKILQENNQAIGEAMLAGMKAALNGEHPKDHPLSKFYKGQAQAYEGDETDTCVCISCATAISNFTLRKLTEDDKGIARTVKSMIDKENGVVREPRTEHRNIPAAYSLADAPGFDKLLAKFGK